MRIEIKTKNPQLPEYIYEKLDAVLMESTSPERLTPYVFGEFTIYQMEKVVQILLEELKHYKELKSKQDKGETCQCEECQGYKIHRSDCAVHNEPALPKGECDCGLKEKL